MIELPPKFDLWLPPKPAIIRRADRAIQKASFLPGMFPGGAAAAAAAAGIVKTVTYIQAYANNANADSYTFTNANIGTAAANRHVIIAMTFDENPSAVTLAGVGMTLLSDGAANGGYGATIWGIASTSGTTGTIVITASDSSSCRINIWAVYGLVSLTPVSTSGPSIAGTAITYNPNLVAGDIFFGCSRGSTAISGHAWVGANERDDAATDAVRVTAAEYLAVATESPRTITCTRTGGAHNGAAGCVLR